MCQGTEQMWRQVNNDDTLLTFHRARNTCQGTEQMWRQVNNDDTLLTFHRARNTCQGTEQMWRQVNNDNTLLKFISTWIPIRELILNKYVMFF